MTTSWAVDTATVQLALDRAGRGEIVFTVSNPDEADDTAVLQVVPGEGTPGGWFAVDRPQRTVPAHGTVSYLVTVAVPADAPAGRYELSALVFSATDPPEESARSSGRVGIEVRSVARPRRRWLPPVVGVALLAITLATVGVLVLRPTARSAGPAPVPVPSRSTAPTPAPTSSRSPTVTVGPSSTVVEMERFVTEPDTVVTVGGQPAKPACDGLPCEIYVERDCCNYGYSEHNALGFFARPFDSFTVTVTVARDGRYELADTRLLGPYSGRTAYFIDGRQVGDEFTRRSATGRLTDWLTHGGIRLTAGAHRVTLTHLPLTPGDVNRATTMIDRLRLDWSGP